MRTLAIAMVVGSFPLFAPATVFAQPAPGAFGAPGGPFGAAPTMNRPPAAAVEPDAARAPRPQAFPTHAFHVDDRHVESRVPRDVASATRINAPISGFASPTARGASTTFANPSRFAARPAVRPFTSSPSTSSSTGARPGAARPTFTPVSARIPVGALPQVQRRSWVYAGKSPWLTARAR